MTHSSETTSAFNDRVVLITGAAGSQLSSSFARYWLETLRPRAVVIVDSDHTRLDALMTDLVDLAWSSTDDAPPEDTSSDEGSVDFRADLNRETNASPGGRTFGVPALISNLIRQEPYLASSHAQDSITQIKSVCVDLYSFPAALRAVKETVAEFGRLDYVFTFPSSATLRLLGESSRYPLTTTELLPIMAAPPYESSARLDRNAASQESMSIDGGHGHGHRHDPNGAPSAPDMRDPRVRGRPLADIHLQLFDRMTRELVNMLHAAVPALICPPRPLRSNLLNVSVPSMSGLSAWSTSWMHGNLASSNGINLLDDGVEHADGEDRIAQTQWTGAKFRLSDKFIVAVMLSPADYGRMQGSPYYDAGLAACRSILSSYAPLVPLPTPQTDEPLVHPPVPRINLKIFDEEAVENDISEIQESSEGRHAGQIGSRQAATDLVSLLVRSLERM